jgi:starch-binding outer membrane protein, SusD/RagB family
MKQYKILITAIVVAMMTMASCVKDLDQTPLDPTQVTTNLVFASDSAYEQFLAKCYGSLVQTGRGTNGGWGDDELSNADEGVTSFLRVLWGAQEMSTDEAINVWGDGDLNEYHMQNWTDVNSYNYMLYKRIFYNITVCNEYIRDVTPRVGGLSGNLKTNVNYYLAEARFLRALFYYYAMDLWGNTPFVTESDPIGFFKPKQIKRADLFAYIEKELLAISPALLAPNKEPNLYGRANRAACWTLLSKLYLNSEVYLGAGNKKYTNCLQYCDSIINSGVYALHTTSAGKFSPYQELFLSDNNLCYEEIIFPIACDANQTQNYGGITFVINAEVGGSMTAAATGIASGWGGNVTTSAFMHKFADPTGATDTRALFYSKGVNDTTAASYASFTDDMPLTVAKWLNLTNKGNVSSSSAFMNNDFTLFRLADVYLMRAEADVRINNTSSQKSVDLVNAILERAYGNKSADVSAAQITLPFLLDERGRELYWEAQRRTDLIRFGQFSTGDYVWDWLGNVSHGVKPNNVNLELYPIPSADRAVNSNLVQNPGY